MLVEWSDEAQLDLVDIQTYIEQFDPHASLALREAIESGVERLPQTPFAFRANRVVGAREYVAHSNDIVMYRIGATAIEVLRVLHARQEYR